MILHGSLNKDLASPPDDASITKKFHHQVAAGFISLLLKFQSIPFQSIPAEFLCRFVIVNET